MSWFMDHAVLFAPRRAAGSVVYSFALIALTLCQLRRPAGTGRMHEASHAIQEGAAAVPRRQYTTVAVSSL
jgi:Na+/H+-translocating membrane pyrophosphatase